MMYCILSYFGIIQISVVLITWFISIVPLRYDLIEQGCVDLKKNTNISGTIIQSFI